jgi:hypothetical protein
VLLADRGGARDARAEAVRRGGHRRRKRGPEARAVDDQAAHVSNGLLGAGWNITGPMPSPFALGGIIEVPWNETNRSHAFRLELIDLDGNPVVLEGLEGSTEVAVDGTFGIGRPSGIRAGSFQPFPFAVNCGPDAVAARPQLRVAVQH